MDIIELIKKKPLFMDGGMGTLLQASGLAAGDRPDDWNITHSQVVRDIHAAYIKAGSEIILSNTFGTNAVKLQGGHYTTDEIVNAAIANIRSAGKCFAALDIGPTGKLLKPLGDLSFEAAYDAFAPMCVAGEKAGADLVCIETMSDTHEIKAAVLAAKENTSLPVFATVALDSRGKLLTGGSVAAVVALLEGLGVDALGLNCGLGPVQLLPFIREMASYASVPLIVKPNAGLPRRENGKTVYDIDEAQFANAMRECVEAGASIIGGCCGTTPAHIAALKDVCGSIKPHTIEKKRFTVVSSYSNATRIGEKHVIIGERINPTGKSALKRALKENDLDYLLREAVSQEARGAHILDVNVGLPETDEKTLLPTVVSAVQSVSSLPLQLDTSDSVALENALRMYNGKALINSVNGKRESMEAVFPLAKKYGGVVVALTLDESGIPETADGRLQIARRIVKEAEKYGIDRRDIVVDVLCMAVAADKMAAGVTLEALKLVREELGVATVLGVSNVSFGLPSRASANSAFYLMALSAGLDAAIINPVNDAMLGAYKSYMALSGKDEAFADYIAFYANAEASEKKAPAVSTLSSAIEKGLCDDAATLTKKALAEGREPLEVIDASLVPALDAVGQKYESGTLFLPQLLMSAEAAKAAFTVLKAAMPDKAEKSDSKKVVLATVRGDIHDIGKNIVKVLLENYGFDVIDLGKDVPPCAVLEAASQKGVKLVGLSALMTTTVPSMEETVKLIKERGLPCKTVVGGAVLSEEYAVQIKADKYAKDAMTTVRYAQEIYS